MSDIHITINGNTNLNAAGVCDAIYRSQIALAQEFLNENHHADLAHVKCLLFKLLPKEYFDYIEMLHEHQDMQIVINIMGGQNLIAPNAGEAEQKISQSQPPQIGI